MLDGIKVLAADQVLAGSLTTRYLSDLGADVIKVENPKKGDPYRYMKHEYDEGLPNDLTFRFVQYNRGKKSLPLNLKSKQGKEIFLQLAEDSDIIVENYRAGKMKEFGLGYEKIKEINNDIIYCSISGYGESNAYSNRPAIDTAIQAMSGLVNQNQADANKPALTGIYIADILTALYASQSILAALVSKLTTEKGRYIDLSMLDSVVSVLNHEAAEYSATEKVPPRLRSSVIPQGIYKTNDGFIAINVMENRWDKFCNVLDLKQSNKFSDPLMRQKNKNELNSRIEDILEENSTEYWMEKFIQNDIISAPVRNVKETFEDDILYNRGIIEEDHYDHMGNITKLNYPSKFSEYQINQSPAPRFGEHTLNILSQLGYKNKEIYEFIDSGIVAEKTGRVSKPSNPASDSDC